MSAPEPASEGLRLDKWLWQARFFKTRALAAQLVGKRRVRINQAIVTKAHHRIRPGDVLTFQGAVVRVVRVVDLGSRRGPAQAEACTRRSPNAAEVASCCRAPRRFQISSARQGQAARLSAAVRRARADPHVVAPNTPIS